MRLPGGVPGTGTLRKDFAFRTITGALELALAENDKHLSVPEQVTRVLAQVVDHIAGKKADLEQVAGLCVGDRQYLMQQLAIALGYDQQWLNAVCVHCDETYDFQLRLSELPVKEAGEGFPEVAIDTAQGLLRMHLPTGADQARICTIDDSEEAHRLLLTNCMIEVDTETAAVKLAGLSEEDFLAIDTAMEDIAPEPVTMLQAECPSCHHHNQVELDSYRLLRHNPSSIFSEIHTLAWHYHWSEAEILAMPRQRRARYLAYIDRARGVNSHNVSELLTGGGDGLS